MSFDALRTGHVIRFPYLWVRESERGETEGRKARPVAVGVRIARSGGEDVLVLFPITSQPPSPGRFAAEIPEMEKRRAGLDVALRLAEPARAESTVSVETDEPSCGQPKGARRWQGNCRRFIPAKSCVKNFSFRSS